MALSSPILNLHGFHDNFINWISSCTSTPIFSILINGSPFDYFAPNRGIRHGDPISYVLSIIFFYVLSRLLIRAEQERRLHGVKVSHRSPSISHIMITDLTIYVKPTIENAKLFLDTFCDGQVKLSLSEDLLFITAAMFSKRLKWGFFL